MEIVKGGISTLRHNSKMGLTVYEVGTSVATNGSCQCHYGFRNARGDYSCAVQCPGIALDFVVETGECYNNGVCNGTGQCLCYPGYRNTSCNVECVGGHLRDPVLGTFYSNECTAQLICDVYPDYVIQSRNGPIKCKDMNPYALDYSRDYNLSISGVYLRVYNGLCQFEDFPYRLDQRAPPVPSCPYIDWCNPNISIAERNGLCNQNDYCIEHQTQTVNFQGLPINSSTSVKDAVLGPPPQGCPSVECQQISAYIKEMNYPPSDNRFQYHDYQPDLAPNHSPLLGKCYCLPGFRGATCNQRCPGATYGGQDLSGQYRFFPTTLNRKATDQQVYGIDFLRGWDSTGDGVPDGVAGRGLINICTGNGFCEEDTTCSCFLTDKGPHTNNVYVTGWRGKACEIECPGGAHSICSRHGVCDDLGICSCFKGFRNQSCEVACLGQRDCNPATGCEGVCNYAGSCQEDGSCICDAAFRGSACEFVCPPFNGLASDICHQRGVCNGQGVCNCYVWYQGVSCEQIASWVIAVVVLFVLAIVGVSVHLIRRWLHNRMRARRRARRERRKVRRTEAAVNRMKGYKVAVPDAMSLQAKGI
eukprot:748537-Hanusia_phi.AAC.4